ncbi:MAG: hypothetical protein ABIQ07_02185 [Ginsengibacter sp.]
MKTIFKELTLPAFWLMVFIFSPKKENKIDELKKADNKELSKPEVSPSGTVSSKIKNNVATVMKVASL